MFGIQNFMAGAAGSAGGHANPVNFGQEVRNTQANTQAAGSGADNPFAKATNQGSVTSLNGFTESLSFQQAPNALGFQSFNMLG